MPPIAPQDTYARLLMRKDPSRGYPLYTPEPDESLPPSYQARGLRIGDLGIIAEDGGFDYLFNICLPGDHEFNRVNGVPETFKRVDLRVGEEEGHEDVRMNVGATVDGQSLVPSAGAGLGFCFSTSAAEGAILVLPDGTEKRDLKNGLHKLQAEAKKNALSWYQFVCSNLGRVVNSDSLYLIMGYHKASSWCLASFSQEEGSTSLSFTLRAQPFVGSDITAAYNWEVTSSVVGRVGPYCGYDKERRNQAVFVRGFKIAIREGLLAALYGKVQVTTLKPPKRINLSRPWSPSSFSSAAYKGTSLSYPSGTSSLSAQDQDYIEQAADQEECPDISICHVPNLLQQTWHPSDIINKFLLDKFSDADVAITHDSQWMELPVNLNDHGKEHDKLIEYICERFMPMYNPVDGTACLQPNGTTTVCGSKQADAEKSQSSTGTLQTLKKDLGIVPTSPSTLVEDKPPSYQTQRAFPSNVLIVGETGSGKSSVINLIAGEEFATVSSSTAACTMEATPYDITLSDHQGLRHHVRLFEIVGLNEPQFSKTDYLTMIEKANTLICQLQRTGGIRLLFCVRGGRITAMMQNNYRLFCDILCQNQVPVAFVITGLEDEPSMEKWWESNESLYKAYGLSCASHACITATRGLNDRYAGKYHESQMVVRDMLLGHMTGGGTSWRPERTGWFIHLVSRLLRWLSQIKSRRRRQVLTVEVLARNLRDKCKFSRSEAEYLAAKIWAKRLENVGPDDAFIESL